MCVSVCLRACVYKYENKNISIYIFIYQHLHKFKIIPVVPHEAVAEVSRTGNVYEELVVVNHG